MNRDSDQELLRKRLREWPDAPLSPRFQEDVWRRIRQADSTRTSGFGWWNTITQWIEATLPKPALAVSYVTLLLAAGLTAGWTRANQTNARVKEELGQRYVQTLDPNQVQRK